MIQMKAAARRFRGDQARVAQAVFVGVHATSDELDRFVSEGVGHKTVLPPEAMAGVLRSASRDMKEISLEEYYAGRAN